MKQRVQKYLSEIGRKGGLKSRRRLEPETARKMVLVREARRAYRRFYISCFWSFDPECRITANEIPWVVEGLRKNGNREAWEVAAKLCR